MGTNPAFFENTVSSRSQLRDSENVTFHLCEGACLRVLFVGNSITRHGVAHHLGWPRDCGMAASAPERDYVHLIVAALTARYGPVDWCIAQAADWERGFFQEGSLDPYRSARDFAADVVILRIGENAAYPDEELIAYDFQGKFAEMAAFFTGSARKVIITSLFWRREVIDRAMEDVARAMGCAYVPIGHLGDRDDCKALGEYAHAGVAGHPGDLGMREIANAILNELTEEAL